MRFLHSLNPLRYLASRIFLWFWLVLLITVFGTVLLSRTLTEQTEIRRLPQGIAAQIQQQLNRFEHVGNVDVLMTALQRHQPDRWLVVDTSSNDVLSDTDLPRDFDRNWLTELSQLSRPRWLKHRNVSLAGPFLLQINGRSLALYQKRERPPLPWWAMHNLPQPVMLLFLLLISAVASFVLAVSISRPLRELLQRNMEFADGKLDSRVNNLIKRQDELGLLGHSFNTMAERISALLTNQQRLLRDISHELRSPLARAQLAIGLSERQQNLQQLPRIKQELDRLDAMLDELLTFSKLDAGQYQLDKHHFNLTELVAEIIDVNKVEADAKQQTVSLFSDTQIESYADSHLIGRAIENILRNAIKYSPPGSEVSCKLTSDTDFVTISITDQGPGLTTEQLDAVFQPFYRVSDSRTSSTGGTGLGLAIVAQIVRQHAGSVVASVKASGGLCVTVQIPVN